MEEEERERKSRKYVGNLACVQVCMYTLAKKVKQN